MRCLIWPRSPRWADDEVPEEPAQRRLYGADDYEDADRAESDEPYGGGRRRQGYGSGGGGGGARRW